MVNPALVVADATLQVKALELKVSNGDAEAGTPVQISAGDTCERNVPGEHVEETGGDVAVR